MELADGTTSSDPRLGRLVQFDEKSRNYPIKALLTPKEVSKPRSYTWSVNKWLDQKDQPSCVGFSWAQELIARPVKVPNIENTDGTKIYNEAQNLDEWEGNSYEGSSVLGGAKAVQKFGYITEYRWAFGIDDLILAVGYKGPVVLGINWYNNMFETDSNGFVHVSGGIAGGHAILCYRVNIKLKEFSLWNSWSADWGVNGTCKVSFSDMDRLLKEEGEACIPVGRKMPKV
jgi:hypothetical protein